MKKAQTVAQVFVFLFALIVAGTILLFGYNMIKGLTENQKKADLLFFEKELSSEIKGISSDFGSIKNLDLELPQSYTGICFINTNYPPSADMGVCADYPLVSDAWQTGDDVFLIPNGEVHFDVNAPISLESGTLPQETASLYVPAARGRVKIVLEGKGGSTLIRPTS